MARPKNLIPYPQGIQSAAPGNIISPNLTGSAITPHLDERAAMAPAQGVADIGKGLQQLGSAASELAVMVERAKGVVDERAFSLVMQKANGDIQAAVAAEPDQSKWGPAAKARLDAAWAEIEKIPMDPKTRALAEYKFKANSIDVTGGLETHAARKTLADATQAIGDTVKDAAIRGDEEAARRTIEGGVASKLITPEQGNILQEQYRVAAAAKKEQSQKDMIFGAVRADPYKALSLIEDNKTDLPEDVRAWGKNLAQQGIREGTAGASDELANRLALPASDPKAISTPEQVDELAKGNQFFTPSVVAAAKKHVARMKSAERKAEVAANAPSLASALYSEIQAYDPKTATYADYVALKGRVDELPEYTHADLNSTLKSKFLGTPTVKASDPNLQLGETILDGMLKKGLFGQFQTETPLKYTADADKVLGGLAKAGDPVLDPAGRPRKEKATDFAKYSSALSAKATAGGKLREWLAMNPKASPDQVRLKVWDLQDNATLGGVFDAMDVFLSSYGQRTPVNAGPSPDDPETTPGERKKDANPRKPALPEMDSAIDLPEDGEDDYTPGEGLFPDIPTP